MRNSIRQILCAALALILMLASMPASAAGAGGDQVYVVDNTVSVYKLPHPLSKLLGTLSYGESVRALARKDGWVRIKNAKGAVGYCESGALSTKNPNTLDLDGYVRAGGAPIYAKPGASYKKLTTAKAGTKLHAVAITPDKKWVRVKSGKRYGYIQASALSKAPAASADAKRIWIVSNHAVGVSRTRDGSDSSAGTVSQGQSFELVKVDGSRVYIQNSKGKGGWVSREAVSTQNPNTLSKTMYAQVAGKILYPNAVAKNPSARLSKGEKVTVVSVTPDGNWSRVKKGGKYYYVFSLLLGEDRAPAEGKALKCTAESALVYSNSKFSGSPIALLKKGDAAYLTGVGGGGLKIRTKDGVTGYCAAGGWKAA